MIITNTPMSTKPRTKFGTHIAIDKTNLYPNERAFFKKIYKATHEIAKGRADLHLGVAERNHRTGERYFTVLASRETTTPLGRFVKFLTGETAEQKIFSPTRKFLRKIFGAQRTSRGHAHGYHFKNSKIDTKYENDFLSQITFAIRDYQDNAANSIAAKRQLQPKVQLARHN